MAKGNRGGNGARESRKVRRATEAEKGNASGETVQSTVNPFANPGQAAIASATNLPSAGTVSTNGPDAIRDQQREAASLAKFPAPEARKAADKAAEEAAKAAADEAAKEGPAKPKKGARESSPKHRALNLDETQSEAATPGVFGQVDHAQVNHTRAEHPHTVGGPSAHIEGPSPRRISDVDDEADVMEQIRLENKADNLYLMRRQERASEKPREYVIQSINARLVEVQGAPILPE